MPRLDPLARLVDVELHAVELVQQVVREFDVGLVDLIDQQHRLHVALERLPHAALDDVVADVVHLRIAELRVAQAGHRVVFVQALLRLGRGLDVPAIQRPLQRVRHFFGELRLAGARLALDQQRPPQGHGRIDGHHQIIGGDVVVGAVKA